MKRFILAIFAIFGLVGDVVSIFQFFGYDIIRVATLLTPFGPYLPIVVFTIIFALSTSFLIANLKPTFWKNMKSKIGQKDFDAKIVGYKRVRLGEFMRFKANFDGALSGGYFTAKIEAPKALPDTKTKETWWPCYDSIIREPGSRAHMIVDKGGRLRGISRHEKTWDHRIPLEYPTGRYKATICLYDNSGSGEVRLRERVEFFIVTQS